MPLFRPTAIFSRITGITPAYLRGLDIDGLILDVDNTLTAHGSQELPADIAAWLEQMRAAGIHMTIASNNTRRRVEPFARRVGLPFASFCCKPSPLGLHRACKRMGVPVRRTALIGDQLFTDALGANLAGVTMLLVRPMQADTKPTIRLKRALEKPLLARYERQGLAR